MDSLFFGYSLAASRFHTPEQEWNSILEEKERLQWLPSLQEDP